MTDDEATKSAYFSAARESRKLAKRTLRKVLKTSIANFTECQGYDKLEKSVSALEVRDHFDLSRKPDPLPADNDSMFEFLGVKPTRKLRSIDSASRLRSSWDAVRQAWAPGVDSPAKVAKFWLGLRESMPDLADLAIW